MQIIELLEVTIKIVGDEVTIYHRKTGMTSSVSLRRLEQWALSQLRKELNFRVAT
jgi:hypothetical protein